jgi:hypothetical protein
LPSLLFHIEQVNILQWAYDHFMRMFVGTNLLPTWYRLLGADMGHDVMMGDMEVIEDPHLLRVGDKAALIDNASLHTHDEPGDGYAYTERIEVGPQCIVGTRAVLSGGCRLDKGSIIMPHTYLSPGVHVGESAVLSGVPATSAAKRSTIMQEDAAGTASSALAACSNWQLPSLIRVPLLGLVVPLVSCFTTILLLLTASYASLFLIFWAMDSDGLDLTARQAYALLPIAFLGYLFLTVLTVVVHKWLLRGRQKAGSSVGLGGVFYHIRAHALVLQTYSASFNLDVFRGTIFAPLYLRLLGASVAPSAYIGTFQVGRLSHCVDRQGLGGMHVICMIVGCQVLYG